MQLIHSVQDALQIANTSVLTAEKKKLQKLWLSRESNLAHKTALAQRTCLHTIRRAAREFSTYTATSTDGFAMRHFALLSDDALTLVSQLFECMEMLGTTIPHQLRYVLVVLIPKATTGFRSIGIFCALHRLWAKCRTAMAQAWENLNPRPYFVESPQPSYLAKNLGTGPIATTRALAKRERHRWCNIPELGQDKMDLALPFPVLR